MNQKEQIRDYSLIGVESKTAVERGLADAEWYQSPVSREEMRELLERKDWPAIRDTIIWFGLIFGSGYLVYFWWGSWFAIFPFLVYSALYASTSDSRWHESSHGTAFRTDWMNTVLYEISSFMVVRQSNVWRWSHTRHHSDTIIRGRDPEIAVPRPPKIKKFVKSFLGLGGPIREFKKMLVHATGKIHPEVASYLPKSEYRTVIIKARIYLLIYAGVVASCLAFQTILPLVFVGLPTFFGSWLMPIYSLTQHAGLAENVLDHRLNCRTVYMNRVNRFLYWNMNYHVEHHMFPLVPYHALPKLHEIVKNDCPPPYSSIVDAFREIIPTVRKQMKDPSYYVVRTLPEGAGRMEAQSTKNQNIAAAEIKGDKIKICTIEQLPKGEVLRFDFNKRTYALYRTNFDNYYATEGICSHGNAHLADGVVIDEMIECAKHNGRFDLRDGSPKRMPVCQGIKTYKVEVVNEEILIDLKEIEAKSGTESSLEYEVVSNRNVGTFIKELVLKPVNNSLKYQPGQYVHLEIPPHQTFFSSFNIDAPFLQNWEKMKVLDSWAENKVYSTRNYSLASNPATDDELKFNVRIAISTDIESISAGTGSSYVFSLKPGDKVKLTGPFGDFTIKENQREMVYIGGGAGMAPIRSHLANLLETQKTNRKISYWYGARTTNDLFYTEYFQNLEQQHANFSFHPALSDAGDDEKWEGFKGYIHQLVSESYLKTHPNLQDIDFYLCGPPPMIEACQNSLKELGIPGNRVSFDAF